MKLKNKESNNDIHSEQVLKSFERISSSDPELRNRLLILARNSDLKKLLDGFDVNSIEAKMSFKNHFSPGIRVSSNQKRRSSNGRRN